MHSIRKGSGAIRIAAALLIMAGVSACDTLNPLKEDLYADYAPKPLSEAVDDNAYNDLRAAVQKDIFKDSEDCFTVDSITDENQKNQCLAGRKIMVASLIGASNAVCLEHLKSIYGNEAATNLVLGTLALGTSAAGAVAGGAGTKSILAALSAFFIGEQSLINSVVYKEVVVPAVVKNIREMRDAQLSVLQSHDNDDIAAYPVSAAMADVLKYHESCSFLLGLQRALDNSLNTQRERQITVLQARARELDLRVQARTATLLGAGKKLADLDADTELKALKKSRDDVEAELFDLLKKFSGQEEKGQTVTPVKPEASTDGSKPATASAPRTEVKTVP